MRSSSSPFTKIAGNSFFTRRTIVFLLCSIILLLMVFRTEWKGGIIAFFALPAIFWQTGNYMYYFLVSENELKVRNHYFFWFENTFKFTAIDKAVFEHGGFRHYANGVCFFTSDSESPTYWGVSLQPEQWEELKKILSRNSIKIVDNFRFRPPAN